MSSLKARVALTTAYTAGLRVSDAALKVRDIDSRRMVMRIEHGKGDKERSATLTVNMANSMLSCLRVKCPWEGIFLSLRARGQDQGLDASWKLCL